MKTGQVRFGDSIQRGLDLFAAHFAVLIVVSLVAWVLSVVSLGILAGPLAVGIILIALALHDRHDPPPEIGDLFRGFDRFVPALLFALVWGVAILIACSVLPAVPCVGPLLAVLAPIVLTTFVVFGLYLIADRDTEFWTASVQSYDAVRQDFWPFLGLTLVAALIGAAGLIGCGIGIVITTPIAICILAVAYRDVFGAPSEGTVPDPAQPPQAPPVHATPARDCRD